MKYILSILIFLLNFSFLSTKINISKWVGEWIALDEWQSEFIISLKEDGEAISNYADGDKGTWLIVDNNVEIKWSSGKSDFIFRGVMGLQRLHKSSLRNYTSGIKKSN